MSVISIKFFKIVVVILFASGIFFITIVILNQVRRGCFLFYFCLVFGIGKNIKLLVNGSRNIYIFFWTLLFRSRWFRSLFDQLI